MGFPAQPRSRFTLGVKLSLFAALLVSAVGAGMAYFLVVRSMEENRAQAESRFRSLANIVAGMRGQGYGGRQYDPMLVGMLVELAEQLGTQLCWAVFQDQEGKVEHGSLNLELLSEAAPRLAESLIDVPQAEQLRRVLDWPGDEPWLRVYRVSIQDKQQRRLGAAVLGFSTYRSERQLREHLLANLLVTLAAILAGLAGAFWLARHFSRPIRSLATAMQSVAQGQLEQKLELRSRDEIGTLVAAFNTMTQGLRERERIRNTFARYVSDQVAERILKQEQEIDLNGELKPVTVMFLDIRGFTTLAEMLHPREVVALLNDYFQIVIEVIFRFEGTINKFIGDSIMAIYGAPQALDFPELRAIMTAVEIQRQVGEINWKRMQEGKPTVNFGIGIHSGEAIAGNIGSARRMEYTVIGRDVNLAERIETTAQEGQILLSETTYRRTSQWISVNAKRPVEIKGILEPVRLFEVEGLKIGSLEEARKIWRSSLGLEGKGS